MVLLKNKVNTIVVLELVMLSEEKSQMHIFKHVLILVLLLQEQMLKLHLVSGNINVSVKGLKLPMTYG